MGYTGVGIGYKAEIMGESDRYHDYRPAKKRLLLGDDNNALMAVFAINIIFFVLLQVLRAIYGFMQGPGTVFNQEALPLFMLPADIQELALQPWTAFTFMFSHITVMELLGNMLWLWAFGYIFQELTGNRKLIPLYLYGGFAGALMFITTVNAVPAYRVNDFNYWLVGAYASNLAIAVATTTLTPDYRIFRNLGGGMPVWLLTLVYLLIDVAGIAARGTAYVLAHLAGAGAGFLFILFIKRGKDPGAWMHFIYNRAIQLFAPQRTNDKENIREKVFYNIGDRQPYRKTANLTQQRIDEILDKINQKGYDFLTEEEKNMLKRASEEDI